MKILFKDQKIVETKNFIVNQDWEVPIPGFFIIASKRSIRSVADFSEEEVKEFSELLVKVRKGMKEILEIEDVYMFQNEDTKHGFHFWIFPRHEWMEKFGRKIQSVKPIMLYAEENMATEKIIEEVKTDVVRMKKYFES